MSLRQARCGPVGVLTELNSGKARRIGRKQSSQLPIAGKPSTVMWAWLWGGCRFWHYPTSPITREISSKVM